jgi:hypothetical protein
MLEKIINLVYATFNHLEIFIQEESIPSRNLFHASMQIFFIEVE